MPVSVANMAQENSNEIGYSVARWPFRVAAVVLSLVFFIGSGFRIIELMQEPPVELDTRLKTGIIWLVMGIICAIVACRGSVFNRRTNRSQEK